MRRRLNARKLAARGDVAGLIEAASHRDPVWDREGRQVDLGVEARLLSVKELAAIPGDEVAAALARVAGDQDPEVRRAAVEALAGREEMLAAEGLVMAAARWSEKDPGLAGMAQDALLRRDPDGNAQLLAAALIDQEGEPASGLAELLVALFDRATHADRSAVLAMLAAALDDDDAERRLRACAGVAALGDRATGVVTAELHRARHPITFALALGRSRDSSVIPALAGLLDSNQPVLRRAAVHAIGELRDPRAAELLLRTAEDDDYHTRLAAAAPPHRPGAAARASAIRPPRRPLL